jgi:AcrR family transcriptional regulator
MHPTTASKDLPARERIVRTAHDLFYRDGIRATGIDRVIAESGVAKLTFYRHFPSKHDLVLAYLARRHEHWMDWFNDALVRYRPANGPAWHAVPAALTEWFERESFRGCAFINAAVELGASTPDVADACRRHKQAMTAAMAAMLPSSRQRQRQARAMTCAVDGAIVRVQLDADGKEAVRSLSNLLHALLD